MEQKIKEIGIRKVNGATTFGIVKNVMIIDLLAPSIISLLIVLPISHYIIKEFLQTMVVEVSISWWVYALTVGIILITLLLSTFFQLYKAANRNPIEALKVE